MSEQALATTKSFSLLPKDLTEAMKFAELIAKSDLAPPGMKGNPGNCFIAVQMGLEMGLAPLQALQNIAVINNRAAIFGDLGKALLLRDSSIEAIEEADMAEIHKTGVARCTIRRKGRSPVTRTFSKDQAVQAGLIAKGGNWKTYPERMLMWRAFWFAARDAAADLLKGLQGQEEADDYQTVARTEDGTTEIQMPKRKSEAPKAEAAPEPAPVAEAKPQPPAEPPKFTKSHSVLWDAIVDRCGSSNGVAQGELEKLSGKRDIKALTTDEVLAAMVKLDAAKPKDGLFEGAAT